ncbi:MAG: hypothetical protein E4H36_04800, partial [Spirochaetales bacterium]
MKRTSLFRLVSLIVVLTLAAVSCQRIFTYSPLSFLQRDPSSLSAQQQVNYAEDILASGTAEDMAAAYALIQALLAADPGNADLQLLAAQLAIGGSGLGSLMTSLDPASGVDALNASLA